MEQINTPYKRVEYMHTIEHDGVKYIREEVVMPQSFSWESTPDKLEDFHTIRWTPFDNPEETLLHFYSKDHGWDKDGVLDINNPIPELEQLFKESLGKDLIYF